MPQSMALLTAKRYSLRGDNKNPALTAPQPDGLFTFNFLQRV